MFYEHLTNEKNKKALKKKMFVLLTFTFGFSHTRTCHS